VSRALRIFAYRAISLAYVRSLLPTVLGRRTSSSKEVFHESSKEVFSLSLSKNDLVRPLHIYSISLFCLNDPKSSIRVTGESLVWMRKSFHQKMSSGHKNNTRQQDNNNNNEYGDRSTIRDLALWAIRLECWSRDLKSLFDELEAARA
jgi:hypothetical protein